MSRPIVWAAAILLGTVGVGLGFGNRLNGVGLQRPAAPATASAMAAPAPVDPVVVLNADLRGHYTVHPSVEGRTLRMMVDTGASLVALSQEDAERAGVKVAARDFTRPLGTANGVVMGAPVRLAELRIGEISVRWVDAVVVPRGRLGTSLLGMSFLKRLKGFEIAGGRLTLKG